jgi:hypothetical protein
VSAPRLGSPFRPSGTAAGAGRYDTGRFGSTGSSAALGRSRILTRPPRVQHRPRAGGTRPRPHTGSRGPGPRHNATGHRRQDTIARRRPGAGVRLPPARDARRTRFRDQPGTLTTPTPAVPAPGRSLPSGIRRRIR